MRVPNIFRLPGSTRHRLDALLRASGYGDAASLAEWLRSKGHASSKSAINRYAARLRASDAARGDETARLLVGRGDVAASRKRRGAEDHLARIDAELRELAARHAALTQELQAVRRSLERSPAKTSKIG